MRLLLDTQALLWSLSAPERLPKKVLKALERPNTLVYMSAVSTWEMAIKAALGKLTVDLEEVCEESKKLGFKELAVTVEHTLGVGALPAHHRDPFDRLLIAQALQEGLQLATQDSVMARYAAPIYWQ